MKASGQDRSSIPGPLAATVLVVDPDRPARAELLGWLRDAGYAIREAATFEEARRLLQTMPPDVLVAGLRLGAFNGLHLIISARAVHPELRAVLLTSSEDAALAIEAERTDAACLVKPILRDAFLAAVARNS
jgi:DNA-binding NtrC family response regulator